mgnify:FL=1
MKHSYYLASFVLHVEENEHVIQKKKKKHVEENEHVIHTHKY